MYPFISQAGWSLTRINRQAESTIEGLLGIRITGVGPDFICADMPVDKRTVQPFGLLHGGASMVLAEALGSYASVLLVSDEEATMAAGIEVGGCHVKAVRSGRVSGVARPIRLGRTVHFWRIDIEDKEGELCCAARLTVKITRKAASQAAD